MSLRVCKSRAAGGARCCHLARGQGAKWRGETPARLFVSFTAEIFYLCYPPGTISRKSLFFAFMLLHLVRTIFPLQRLLNNHNSHPSFPLLLFGVPLQFFPSFPDLGGKAERQSRDRLHDSISPRLLAPGDSHLVQSCYLIHTMIDRL